MHLPDVHLYWSAMDPCFLPAKSLVVFHASHAQIYQSVEQINDAHACFCNLASGFELILPISIIKIILINLSYIAVDMDSMHFDICLS